jgi:hypothetical protein
VQKTLISVVADRAPPRHIFHMSADKKSLSSKGGCETVATNRVEVGDVIEAITYGLGSRDVMAVEPDGVAILVFTLAGEPWETTRGATNQLRLRRQGQFVWREVA